MAIILTPEKARQIDSLRHLGFSVEQIEQMTEIPAYEIREYLAHTSDWTPDQ